MNEIKLDLQIKAAEYTDEYLAKFDAIRAGKIRKTLEKRYLYNGVLLTVAEHTLSLYTRYGNAVETVDITHGVPDIDQRAIDRAFDTFNVFGTKDELKSAGLWHDTELSGLFMADKTGYGGDYRTAFKKEVIKLAQRHTTEYRFFMPDDVSDGTFFTMTKTEYDFLQWIDNKEGVQ